MTGESAEVTSSAGPVQLADLQRILRSLPATGNIFITALFMNPCVVSCSETLVFCLLVLSDALEDPDAGEFPCNSVVIIMTPNHLT